VESRRQLGHWEIDTVMGTGCKACILSLVERKTGFLLIGELAARAKEPLNQRVIPLIKWHASAFKTIAADNGTEFHDYKDIEQRTPARFYFVTPHHAWERGSNENVNGLIRQYLPKGASMAGLAQQPRNAIAHQLNTRPRKRLGFKTPLECFYES
jgi:transposase, IS30 family